MADVKVLKINSSGAPQESSPTSDQASLKGIDLSGQGTFRLEHLGRSIVEKFPSLYQSLTYSGSDVTALEFFNSAVLINANRVARYDFTYNGDSTLATEVLVIYDTDGTTVLRTYTTTHTYSSGALASSALVIT